MALMLDCIGILALFSRIGVCLRSHEVPELNLVESLSDKIQYSWPELVLNDQK